MSQGKALWLLLAGFLAAGPAIAQDVRPPQIQQAPDDEGRGIVGIFIYEDDEAPGGAKVEKVKEDSPAAKAGLKAGDVVVSFNGKKVANSAALAKRLAKVKANEEIRLGIEREGWGRELTLKAAARPEEAKPVAQKPFLGLALEASDGALKVQEAVAGGPAASAGVKSGDAVRGVEGKNVATLDDLAKMLEGKKPGDTITLQVERDGWTKDVKVKLGARPGETAAETPRAEKPVEPKKETPVEPKKEVAEKKPGFLGVYLKDSENGLLVDNTISGAPAERAGLKNGDVIVTVEGHPVRTLAEFTDLVSPRGAGEKVTLGVRREGWTRTVNVTLGDRPGKVTATPAPTPTPAPKKEGAAEKKPGFLGVAVEETDGGLRIVEVLAGSPAEKAGLKVGQTIRSATGKPVKTIDEFGALLRSCKAGDALDLQVDDKTVQVTLAPRED